MILQKEFNKLATFSKRATELEQRVTSNEELGRRIRKLILEKDDLSSYKTRKPLRERRE